jgi:GT2 family glycosyltransferase
MLGAPTLAVVVPALNAEATLPACLAALAASDRRPDEILLYDDGSSDATGAIARAHGARVLRNDGPPRGPGAGRNAGVQETSAGLVAFVDADVTVHPTALGLLEAELLAAGAAAAFGSYDDRPASKRLPALYANLRHHHVHQGGDREAGTFWAGLGMVRRDAFLAVAGFDPAYRLPSIEDIELGLRLAAAGHRLRLVPEAQGTHLKDWGLKQLWRTDIRQRALPWSRLIAAGAPTGGGLNLRRRERASAGLALVALLALLALPFSLWGVLPLLAALAGYVALNRGLLALIARHGPVAALAGLGLHLAYHLYASVIFVGVQFWARLRPSRQPQAKGDHREHPDHA